LNLNKNKIKGNDIKILITQCPKLYKLKIEENKIESPNIFFCLNKLNLRKLNIKGNPVCNKLYLDYRKELFNNIKSLEAIDNIGKNEENIESTEYEDNEDYIEKEEFEVAESDEDNKEETKNGGNDDFEEEYENEDEHNFYEDINNDDNLNNNDFND
jgi:hypothetical protein